MSGTNQGGAETADDLHGILASIWTKLRGAAKAASDPWHLPGLATVSEGEPRVRTVVLRGVDVDAGTLRCHTDRRSPKVAELQASPRIAWLFYDPGERLQLRVTGIARVLVDGPEFERAWAESPVRSRKCYLAPLAPSTAVEQPSANLPVSLLDRDPTPAESEPGRENFAVIVCEAETLDWVRLAHDGHLRATYDRDDGQWLGRWTAP